VEACSLEEVKSKELDSSLRWNDEKELIPVAAQSDAPRPSQPSVTTHRRKATTRRSIATFMTNATSNRLM